MKVRSLADVIAFNSANAGRELRYFGQEIMEQAQAKGPLTEKKLSRRAGKEPYGDASERHRCNDREAQARRDRGADAGAGGADRSRERRSWRRWIVHRAGGGGRVSACDGTDGTRARAARRNLLRGPGVERVDPARGSRTRFRADGAGAAEADLCADGGPGRDGASALPVRGRGGGASAPLHQPAGFVERDR